MVISSVIVAAFFAWVAWEIAHMARVWRRLSGVRLVTCTTTGQVAAVRVDAKQAAVNVLLSGDPDARIAECSLWATCGLCDRGCLRQAIAEESALKNVVDRWYASKKCMHCGRPIGAAQSAGHPAALLSADGVTREWSEVPVDRIVAALKTNRPLCWNCHVAATLRRDHPHMVTDRPWPKNAQQRAR